MIEARVHTHALNTKAVFTVFSEYPKPKSGRVHTSRQAVAVLPEGLIFVIYL